MLVVQLNIYDFLCRVSCKWDGYIRAMRFVWPGPPVVPTQRGLHYLDANPMQLTI